MSKFLFIGGGADGQWKETSGQPFVRVPKRGGIGIGGEMRMVVDEYVRAEFYDANREVQSVYMLRGVTNPMALLIANYRPGETINVESWDVADGDREKLNEYLCRGGRPHRAQVLLPPCLREGAMRTDE